LHSLNYGIANDQTQNVLWRVENGELDFEVEPKVVVLLVGTHNVSHTADQVALGICKLAKEIRSKLKKAYVIVLSIPPRGREQNALRDKLAKINQMVESSIEKDEKDAKVKFLCCSRWHEFVNPTDGTISHTDMYDYLHFTNEGYDKFCEPIVEDIAQLLSVYET
jgi:platelet-activating factor acetylhydrolase IB subunit beta/gamma